MLLDILKGFLIGICASVPIGPIAMLVIQESLSKGRRAGFMTGLGSTLVDTLFTIVAIFALAFTEAFIASNRNFILVGGGIVVALIGVYMTFSDPFRKLHADGRYSYSVKDFLQAVAMGISNPGAIVAIFALFAFFQIEVEANDFRIAPLVLSVALGSAVYWFGFSGFFSHIRKNFKLSTILWINRVSGAVVMIIGVALFAEGVMKWLFK